MNFGQLCVFYSFIIFINDVEDGSSQSYPLKDILLKNFFFLENTITIYRVVNILTTFIV